MKKGDQLEVLHMVESKLPLWLTAPGIWNTLNVDYESPRVERLWASLDDLGAPGHRAYLHRIFPCETPLFHSHPWPSAVRIISGRYEMVVGWDMLPAATMTLTPGSEYEMIDYMGWHSVKPIACASLSVMVTGPKWSTDPNSKFIARPTKPLNPLSQETKEELLETFLHYYK